MFINQSFVAITFKFINFFALIVLGSFIFKKYLKTDMLSSIAKKETDHQNLVTQQIVLENKQRDLDLLIKEEIIQCHNFQSKIDEWNKVVLLEQDKQEKEYIGFVAVTKKRAIGIALKKDALRVQNIVINSAIADVKKSLAHDFKDSKIGTDYLDAIVDFMNEKIS